jgi:P4 family phage/plasmid primase-like protien
MFKKSTPTAGLNKEVKNTTNKKKDSFMEPIENVNDSSPSPPTPSKKISSKDANYFTFMKSHLYDRVNKDHTMITNTRIGDKDSGIFGASYYISDEDYPQFLKSYYNEVFVKKKPEYLTEKQLENNGPLLIDIDLRHDFNIEGRYYSQEHIEDILDDGYLEILKEVYYFDEETEFNIYVFEKNDVNRVQEKNVTKDGIHILVGIQCDHVTQQLIRKQMIPKLEEIWGDFPIINTWDDVLDEGISTGAVNWQLYGSRKPHFEPYKLTSLHKVSYDEDAEHIVREKIPLSQFKLKDNFEKLSARYSGNPSFVFNTDFSNFREEAIANGEVVTAADGNGRRTRNGAPTAAAGGAIGGLTGQSYSMMNSALSLNTIFQIKTQDELTEVVNQFIDYLNSSSMDYKLKEAYDYTMALPKQYYGEGSYLKWIAVGWALRNTSDMLFIVWIAFSAKSPSFHFHDIRQLYEDRWLKFDLNNPNGLTILSIMRWCKIDAASEYKKIRENSIDYFIDQSLGIIEKDSDEKPKKSTGDFDIAVVLYQYLKSMYACVDVQAGIWYRYDNHRWVKDNAGTSLRKTISIELRDMYRKKSIKLTELKANEPDETKAKMIGARIDKILDICLRLARTSDKNHIMQESRDLFYDAQFFEKLDTNPYLLCFNNGVIDFKTKTFRHGYPEDYITKTTKIDYVPIDEKRDADKIHSIQEFMHQLFPVKELHDYMWEHLASVLIGTSSNQTFNMYVGVGQNGKSVLITLMDKILGEYKGDVPLTLVTERRSKIGGATPELVALKGLRYAVMQEPSKGDRLNEGIMKQITSGLDPIQCRSLYAGDCITYIPQFKLVVCANEFMEIKSQDHGTWRRIRVVDFLSMFVNNPVNGDKHKPYQFKMDPDITEKFNAWKECFAALLVKKAFETNGIVRDCDTVMKSSNSYRQSQDYIAEFISDKIIDMPNGKVTKQELTQEFNAWYQNTYGNRGGPSIKDVQGYMDKRFGRFDLHKCWVNIGINYNRNPVIVGSSSSSNHDEDGDEYYEDDIDVDEL